MSESSLVVAAMRGQTAAVNSTFFLFLACLIRELIVIWCVREFQICLQLMANRN